MSNPLLESSNHVEGAIPFDQIETSHFIPALEERIKEGLKSLDRLLQLKESTFENTIVAVENITSSVNEISSIFYNLSSANTNDQVQAISKEFSEKITNFYNDLTLNSSLFERVKKLYEQKDELGLDSNQTMLLEKSFKGFVRNGALLDDSEKDELRKLDTKLSELSISFGENVLHDTNNYEFIVNEENKLLGIPDSIKAQFAEDAKAKGHAGKWRISLHAPSIIPALIYLKNRDLRKELMIAYKKVGFSDNQYDNKENILEIVRLKRKRANLLGFKSHNEYVLSERMAENEENVREFINDLYDKSFCAAKEEIKELEEFAQKLDGINALKAWDYMHYAEKLKKEKYDFDTEILRPYFKLENVIDGVFKSAKKLYGLSFTELSNLPKYHEDVKTYQVTGRDGEFIGLFYADFFPRDSKSGGAWMTTYRDQFFKDGKDSRPHVSIVCNFSKPTEDTPSLLDFNEVLTLFHEFGHALHGLLSKVPYRSISGPNVYWDFVELPSQVMENWAYEKECLDLFAVHYKTSEKIPEELIQKLKRAASFHEGRNTIRQLSLATLDLEWHGVDSTGVNNVDQFEKNVFTKFDLVPHVEDTNMSCSFTHIFKGGYSSGYYSYKWAEVLDADAFESFKENGVFDQKTAESFKQNILEKGGSEHPMALYKKFKGREPKVEALLKRAGLC